MSTQTVGRYFPEWTVADRLRRIRRETGLTQEAFAEQLQVKPQRYSAWESGRNQPPMQDFVTIAKRIEMGWQIAAEWTLGLDAQIAPRPDGPGGDDDQGMMDGNMVRYSNRIVALSNHSGGTSDQLGSAA